MSRENVELVRRSWEAFVCGDFEAALEPLAPGVEFDLTSQPGGEVLQGHDGVWEGMRRWVSAWDSYEMELEEFVDAGDRVLILFRERGRGRQSGVETEASLGAVWTVRDGRVSRMQPFRSRSEAYEAAGVKPTDR